MFVNPPKSGNPYEWIERLGSKLPSIGLCSLAAYTREHGFDTGLLDAFNLGLSPEAAVGKVLEFSPTHVGITAITSNIVFAAEFAKLLKKRDPGIITIIGGTHISAMPEETMQRFRDFDIGVLGEGEETITEILDLPIDTEKLDTVKGIIYRVSGSNLKKTNRRPFIKDLDRLPYPAWDLLPGFPDFYRPSPTNFKRLPVAALVTSRGCPYGCTFCARSVFGNKYRFFSADYITGLIDQLQSKYGVREICFYDDTFTANRERLAAICEYFIKTKIKLSWSCLGRVNLVDEEILKLMKKANCWLISYGIESASQEILDLYCKKITLAQIEHATALTKKAGIITRGFFIIGGPLETDTTIRQMKALIKKIPLDDIHISFFTPIPGSELYDTADKYGTFSKEWPKVHVYTLNFIPNDLSGDRLIKYRSEMYRHFYLRPAKLLRYLLITLHPRRMVEIIKRGWAFLKLTSKRRP